MDDYAAAAELFQGFPEGAAILHAVQEAVSTLSETTMKVTKSQVAFRRRRGFAYVWRPGQYINSDVPAVLSTPTGTPTASAFRTSPLRPGCRTTPAAARV